MKGQIRLNTSCEVFFLFQRLLTLLITSLKLWKPNNNYKYVEYLNIWERFQLKRKLKSSLLPIFWVLSLLGKPIHALRSWLFWGPLSNTAVKAYRQNHLRSITIPLCIFIRYLSKCIDTAIDDLDILLKFYLWKQITEQWFCLCWKETYAYVCV